MYEHNFIIENKDIILINISYLQYFIITNFKIKLIKNIVVENLN